MISRQTSQTLELITSNHHEGGDKAVGKHGPCLLSVMDECTTASGRKLLRTSLLAPPTDLNTIQLRQHAIEELSKNDSLFFGVQNVLRKCPTDLQKTLSWGVRLEKKSDSVSIREQTVSHCILIIEALETLPELISIIGMGKSAMF